MNISSFPGKENAKEEKSSFEENQTNDPRGVIIRHTLLGDCVDFYVFLIWVHLRKNKKGSLGNPVQGFCIHKYVSSSGHCSKE